jgi:uncharacterized protein (TIGR02996 family)
MTNQERAFLDSQLQSPSDVDLRLVYSDWLEERGDAVSMAKAEFLLLTASWMASGKGKRSAPPARLQELAAALDPEWLAVVSELNVERCGQPSRKARQKSPGLVFDVLCHLRWTDLRMTEDPTIRFCDRCEKNVHYCETIRQARDHAWEGHCIAVDLGIPRREGDLEHLQMSMGLMSAERLRAIEDSRKLDPVSEARENRSQGHDKA